MLKKLTFISAAVIGLSVSTVSQAQVVTHDPMTTAQIIKQMVEDMKKHVEQLDADNKNAGSQIYADSMNTDRMIDAFNNGFANNIGRLSENQGRVMEAELKREMAPGQTACIAVAGQAFSSEALCEATQQRQASTHRHRARHATAGMSEEAQRQITRITQEEHFDACTELGGGDFRSDVCANAGSIMGTTTGATMSPEEMLASERFVDYIVGISPLIKQSYSDPENMTPSEKISYNREQEAEAFRSLVAASMEAVTQERVSPDPVRGVASSIQNMERFTQERYGDTEWGQKVTGTHQDPDQKMTDSQLNREKVMLMAFQTDLQIKQYKQSLRQEALMAAILSKLSL